MPGLNTSLFEVLPNICAGPKLPQQMQITGSAALNAAGLSTLVPVDRRQVRPERHNSAAIPGTRKGMGTRDYQSIGDGSALLRLGECADHVLCQSTPAYGNSQRNLGAGYSNLFNMK